MKWRPCARALSATLLFSTMLAGVAYAQQPDTSELSFVVVGHVRGAEDGKRNYLFPELLRELRESKPDLVFLTGDMIWGGYDTTEVDSAAIERDWQALDSALATVGVPVYRVPGNHDINDPVTRDIYFRRYGRLPQVVDVRGVRFILLNSSFVPVGDRLEKKRRPFIGGVPLDTAQILFLQNSLRDPDYRHAFVFLHHVLWWDDDAPWWSQVHPVLRGGNTRAVFAGDYGPMKFSHEQRDGIDYLQSAIEDFPGLRILQRREESRLLYQQFDNYLHVTVRGSNVDVEVKTLGALTGGKFTPNRFKQITGYEPTRAEQLRAAMGSPKRLGAVAVLLIAVFGAGALAGRFWQARRTRK